MNSPNTELQELWRKADFTPNEHQREAIEYIGGPIFLTAGPGSGKTRVLLWRTVNLILNHQVRPEDIFLSTFTEKAANQLQEGLRTLLALVSERTGRHYDLANMYVGTLHSLCQQIISDRRFSPDRRRPRAPVLMDALKQYLYVYRKRDWNHLVSSIGWNHAVTDINSFFGDVYRGQPSTSRHKAVISSIALFNRFSEECLEPKIIRSKTGNRILRRLIDLYAEYRKSLETANPPLTDFSLLQQSALRVLQETGNGTSVSGARRLFKHVIVDEYQDTNTIQEQLIFALAATTRNICVVGDDDQALYRFRGATVENFVQFPQRCQRYFDIHPKVIPLETNYRSRKAIVDFYRGFITHHSCDWRKNGRGKPRYRVPKDIHAHRTDDGVSVIASAPDKPTAVCAEIASLVKRLIVSDKVDDPNQIAFLYPSLKSPHVVRMRDALENVGLRVYAPRAGTFLEVDEATDMLGLMMYVFGKPERGDRWGSDYNKFYDWVDAAAIRGKHLFSTDARLERYIRLRRFEIRRVTNDYKALVKIAEKHGWDSSQAYNIELMKRPLANASGLSDRAKKTILSPYIEKLIRARANSPRPITLGYLIVRSTSLDWNVLDLFYRLCGFKHFRKMFEAAENLVKDEGPLCNLSLLSQYLARFLDEYNSAVLSAEFMADNTFQQTFFASYLYALFRRGEAEYEDSEDPFPRGRIPFLTIHQAKGLEFPVVVLGNLRKDYDEPQAIEKIIQPLLRRGAEPLDRMAHFDVMRMFYVALSRAKNLLVLAHYCGQGQRINDPFQSVLDDKFPRIRDFTVQSLPKADLTKDELPKTYSYTGDFLLYKRCPRQYMVFRRYDFAPARSQTMFFGSLVHQTIDDLHQRLIAARSANGQEETA